MKSDNFLKNGQGRNPACETVIFDNVYFRKYINERGTVILDNICVDTLIIKNGNFNKSINYKGIKFGSNCYINNLIIKKCDNLYSLVFDKEKDYRQEGKHVIKDLEIYDCKNLKLNKEYQTYFSLRSKSNIY